MFLEMIGQKSRKLLLTINVEVIGIVKILVFVQSDLCDIPLIVEIIKAVFGNDVTNRITSFKALKGALRSSPL